jgi:hypothetical protein
MKYLSQQLQNILTEPIFEVCRTDEFNKINVNI